MSKLSNIDFYFITDSNLSKDTITKDVENAIKAGCKIIQYREKEKNTEQMVKEAKKIKKICERKALFIINDRVDVALAVNADGVHLGKDDISFKNARGQLGENKIIGLTVHDIKEAVNAEEQGADYIGLAPIFKTNTKRDAINPIGIKTIKIVRKKVNIPIVALGGIDKNNIKQVISAGADSVASISAIFNSSDVYNEIKEFLRIIKECKIE